MPEKEYLYPTDDPPNKDADGGRSAAHCSPIRSLEEFKKAGEAWLNTEWIINQTDNPEERKRATAYQLGIERRMDEARPLFGFDDEGNPISLANDSGMARRPNRGGAPSGNEGRES